MLRNSFWWKVLALLIGVLLLNGMIATAEEAANMFYVYDETDNEKYVWYPSGYMPDGSGISFTDKFTDDCYQGKTCIKVAGGQLNENPYWRGIYWLPAGGFEGPGIDVYKLLDVKPGSPIYLTFWVKGETGEEQVQFKVGGVADGNDSIEFPLETDYLTLGTEWTKHKIDLSEEDLSRVVGGFCWVTNRDQNIGKEVVRFFLDEIRYEVK